MEHIYTSISKKLKDRDIVRQTCSQVDFNVQLQRHDMTMEDVCELESLLTDVIRKYKDVKQFQKPKKTYTNNTIDKILKDTNVPNINWGTKLIIPNLDNVNARRTIISTPRRAGKSSLCKDIMIPFSQPSFNDNIRNIIKRGGKRELALEDEIMGNMAKEFEKRIDADLIEGLGLGKVRGKCRTAIFVDDTQSALNNSTNKKGQQSVKSIIDKYRIVA